MPGASAEQREARRPWIRERNDREAPKERNNCVDISHFQCSVRIYSSLTRGDAFRCASRLPLAIILRAFGAQFASSYSAPSVLNSRVHCAPLVLRSEVFRQNRGESKTVTCSFRASGVVSRVRGGQG